jgi:hypothetical protein
LGRRYGSGASVRLAAGLLLGGVALWLALRGADAAALSRSLAAAAPAWVAAALLSVAMTIAAGVARWRLLLVDARWRPLTDGLIVGQMLNIVLPIRLGELARAYIVSRAERLPAARVFTTIAVEKVADLMAVGLAAALLLMFATLPAWIHAPGRALVLTGVAAAAAAAFAFRPGVILWMARAAQRLAPASWHARIERQFTAAAEGVAALRSPSRGAALWLLTIVVLLLAASTNYLLFFAFDLRLPPLTALLLLLALQVGTAIAPVPGNLGVFHYVAVLVLTAYGIDRTTALAYALALYAVAILPKVAAGGALLVFQYRWVLGPAGVKP